MKNFKMRINVVAVLLLLITICFIKCKNDDVDKTNRGGDLLDGGPVDVYITGGESDATGNISTAEYWKNGVVTKLTDGKNNAFAQAIAVSGSDIYILGFESINNKTVIKYWKNGTVVNVTDGTHAAYAYNIAVYGSDVYVCGYERDDNGNDVAKYWKNGAGTILPHANPTDGAEAVSIKVSGSDVYVAGTVGSQTYNAVVWKNGVLTNLPTTSNSVANAMALYNNNLFVAGADGQANASNDSNGTYWLNGSKVTLANIAGCNYGEARCIAVSGNDVYLAGESEDPTYKSFATYWKNGTPVKLTDGTRGADAYGIAVNGNDVYVIGDEATAAHNSAAPRCWKNGVSIPLPSGIPNSYAGNASSIALVRQQ